MSRFDKEIKDRLEGYSSPVSSDMWSRISSNLPPQEQTNPKTWWLPIVGITVVMIGVISLFLIEDRSSSRADELRRDTHASVMNKEFDKSAKSTTSDAPSTFTSDVSSTATTNTYNSNVDVKSVKPLPETNKMVVSSDEKQRNSTSKELYFQNQTIIDGTSDVKSLAPNENSTTLNTNESTVENTKEADDNELVKKAAASLYKQYNAIINKTRELKSKDKENIVERSEEIFIAPLRIEDLTVESIEATHRFSLPREKLICPSFNNLRFGVFLESFYSNDFGMRALSYNGPVGDVDYLNIRNNTEQANYSFSTGARVSFMLPSGLGAKTGINYSQINETFKFEDPKSKQTKKVIIKEYQWENGVIVDSTEVTKEIEIPGKLTVINQNKYKIIDLPLLFTYEWGHKKRLYYSVTAGPMFNIKFTQQGKFLDPETLTPVDFSSDDGNYKAFTTNIGTSMYMSFALNYQLGNGLDVFVEPNVRYFLKNATVNTYLLNQKYTVLGLGLGVKYKL